MSNKQLANQIYDIILLLGMGAHRLGNVDGCDTEEIDQAIDQLSEIQAELEKEPT